MAGKKNKKKGRNNQALSLTVAKGISEMIKFSVDDDFRKRSFRTLGVTCTKDAENEVYRKLLIFAENPKSLAPQTVTFEEEYDKEYIEKSEVTHLPEDLPQKVEEYEVLNEYKPDLSATIFSQICLQISREQEEIRLREKNFFWNTNPGLIYP